MGRRLAISDIHGCNKTFNRLLESLAITKQDQLFLLGDYIDRGKNSKGVIDTILDLQKNGYDLECLRGNHEQLLLKGISGDQYMLNVWLKNGGVETMTSYNLTDPEKLPDPHLYFLQNTKYYIELPDYILVHAGINFEIENYKDDVEAMMWLRKFEVYPMKIENRSILHGHTPISFSEIINAAERLPQSYRMDIDNGCYYVTRKGCGGLVAFDLDTKECHRMMNCD